MSREAACWLGCVYVLCLYIVSVLVRDLRTHTRRHDLTGLFSIVPYKLEQLLLLSSQCPPSLPPPVPLPAIPSPRPDSAP